MKQSAEKFIIRVKGVEKRRERLKTKLDLKTNADLIKFGIKMGIIGLD